MSTLTSYLDGLEHPVKVGYVSSYIPRKCGIATYTKNLTNAINLLNPTTLADIVALEPEAGRLVYPPEVRFTIAKQIREEYRAAAKYLNESGAEVVSIQHEFGLFGGGREGSYVLDLLEHLTIPAVITVHTILENPPHQHRALFNQVCELADAVVVMLPNAQAQLLATYEVPEEKVVVIHHGVEDRPRSRKQGKKQLGWEGRRVLLMSGLIGPDKGIDVVLRALPDIIARKPDTLLVIAGQTHPEILAVHGETYREHLQRQVEDLGLSEHVVFINQYFPLDELLSFYEACDIFLTPHLNPQQVTSGTLAYAIGMGKACISTKYTYAKEVLDEDRGVLVGFNDSREIHDAVLLILENPEIQAAMEAKAYQYGRQMSWPRVAERYLNLFRKIAVSNPK